MKEKVQERINQMQTMATIAPKRYVAQRSEVIRSNDSLSKAIRNVKEAEVFLADLKAVVNMAKFKKA
jgi:hypothetical protein